MSFLRPVALLALAALCVLPALPRFAAAEDAPAPAPLKFAWPLPCRVRVTEKALKRGRETTTSYLIGLTKEGDAGDVRLHLSAFEILVLAGRPASDPDIAPLVAQALPMTKAIPDLLLSSEGRVKDVIDIQKAIDQAFSEMEAVATEAQKKEIAARRAQLSTAEAKQYMNRSAREFWDAWVGNWIGMTVSEAEPLLTTHVIVGPDGTAFDAPATVKRTSVKEGAQLFLEAKLEGEQARQALEGWVKKMTEASNQAPPDGFFTGLEAAERVVAVTDPATLKPLRVSRELTSAIRRKNGQDTEVVERHDYTFDWDVPAEAPKAEPPGK